MSGTKLAKAGATVTYTLYVVNGETAIPNNAAAAVVLDTEDTAFPDSVPTSGCTPALNGLAANTAATCTFTVTVTAGHVTATKLPSFAAKVVTGYPGSAATPATEYIAPITVPEVALYTVPSITAAAPVVAITGSVAGTDYVDGELFCCMALHC